jgi:hypothetical protein
MFKIVFQTSARNVPLYAGIPYRNFFLSLNFIPAYINIKYIYLSSSIFPTVYPCFAFKKYTGTSKFTFTVLCEISGSQGGVYEV